MKTNKILDQLVESKTIKSYSFENNNLYNNKDSDHDNYENLILEFNNGQRINICGFCSGSLSNVTIDVERYT